MGEVTFIGAFIAGILSFLSPCVLPLVPAYLSYISGVSVDTLRAEGNDSLSEKNNIRTRAITQALWFILGFSLIFILLGASATWLGQWLLNNLSILGQLAGAVITIFGLHYTGIIRIPFLMMEARINTQGVNAVTHFGALALGAAFAFGWTPCIGPILGAILAIAGSQHDWIYGLLLLALYSMGLGIPFLLSAMATNSFMLWSQKFKRHMRIIEIFSGMMLLGVGVLMILGSFSEIAALLIRYLPWLADLETLIQP
ncbi:MAG: cytochrome c biogenesis protein CcdA [Zetaproteobacteria bacterium]|nr:cytochrome c biogenesis protein CcdA [Zetaproteobacteria bacterium]